MNVFKSVSRIGKWSFGIAKNPIIIFVNRFVKMFWSANTNRSVLDRVRNSDDVGASQMIIWTSNFKVTFACSPVGTARRPLLAKALNHHWKIHCKSETGNHLNCIKKQFGPILLRQSRNETTFQATCWHSDKTLLSNSSTFKMQKQSSSKTIRALESTMKMKDHLKFMYQFWWTIKLVDYFPKHLRSWHAGFCFLNVQRIASMMGTIKVSSGYCFLLNHTMWLRQQELSFEADNTVHEAYWWLEKLFLIWRSESKFIWNWLEPRFRFHFKIGIRKVTVQLNNGQVHVMQG